MTASEQIILIGEFRFPDGDAAAVRTLSLARICRDLGFRVVVIGKGRPRPQDYDEVAGAYSVEGIRYATMNPEPLTSFDRLRNPVSRLRIYATTLAALDLRGTRAVIVNASSSARHVPLVQAFCRDRSIPLIADVCEWYDPRQMKHGFLDPSYAIFSLVFHRTLPRIRNLIVVSKLLERHFQGDGRRLIRISAPFDVSQIPCVDRTPADRLSLVYAGQPGRKDQLREMVVALASLGPAERARVEFRVFGPTEEEFVRLLGPSAGLLKTLAGVVKPMGRVPRERVLEAFQQAHFSVLLRPDRRYAHAGFPSKVAEGLAAGVPLFANFTSDLKEYLGDGRAALEVRDCSVEEVARTLRRALALSSTELLELRRGARRKAEDLFDYRIFVESFGEFLRHAN